MSFFVEYYDADATDNLMVRTGEMDYAYQAEQAAIDALEQPMVVRVRAFFGVRPAIGTKTHDQPMVAEWQIIQLPDGKRDLKRLL